MKKSLFFLLILSLLLAGCLNSVNTIENANPRTIPQVIQDKRFITDKFLRDRLGLHSLIISRTPDGRLKAQLQAVNLQTGFIANARKILKKWKPYRIQYKFTWFTQDGMAVEIPLATGWRELTVIPGEYVYLQGVAPRPECVDFNVSLKEAD